VEGGPAVLVFEWYAGRSAHFFSSPFNSSLLYVTKILGTGKDVLVALARERKGSEKKYSFFHLIERGPQEVREVLSWLLTELNFLLHFKF
jgi:hypothetical protein